MDPVSHAASGAIALMALRSRPATAWALPLAALACASPDIDLVFCHSPLDVLLLHRGITHALAASPVFGFILALFCWPLWRKSTPGHWKFWQVWLFCIGMIWLHDWLDVVTTYGTMIFLPFSHYRVRLNSIYIIDLLVTIPLLLGIFLWHGKRRLILLVFAWIFFYPAAGIALNAWHTGQAEARFEAENRNVDRIHVLPDAFAPFFWRMIFEEEKDGVFTVRSQGLDVLGKPRTAEDIHPAAPKELVDSLMARSTECAVFFDFAVLPVMDGLRPSFLPKDSDNPDYRLFYDLRFGSNLEFVQKILAMRPDADLPFLLMTGLGRNDAPELVRLRFSDSGRDSGWHRPDPIHKPEFLEWLVGLR